MWLGGSTIAQPLPLYIPVLMHFLFYLRLAWRNLSRNRQRTLFVLLCIAVGVAAVVSLRSVGLMIGDALLANLQADNRGDIRLSAPNQLATLATGGPTVDPSLVESVSPLAGATFSQHGIAAINAWAQARGYAVNPAHLESAPMQARKIGGGDAAETINPYFVDPAAYPFYHTLTFTAPPDTRTLSDRLVAPRDIVISDSLAEALDVGVGDQLLLTGARDPFTVTAIVSAASEASLTNPEALLIPFVYLSYTTGQNIFSRAADTIFLRLPTGSAVTAARDDLRQAFPGLSLTTTEDLRAQNQTISDWLTRLVTLLGLVSLLIGGIGIMNTMIVVVRRRMTEIGILKTLGLQAGQITWLFLIEALALGVVGSLFGLGLGLGLTLALQRVGERLAAQTLTFRLYPEALFLGLVTGVMVTLVFGLVPTLSAGRVRPNVALNPHDDAPIPPAGRLQSGLVILGLILVMGLLVGRIMQNYLIGLALVFVIVLLIGALLIGLWVLVLLLSILPNGGRIRLKLAQRALGAQRLRAATTLLASVIGIFGLSVLLIFTQSLLGLIATTFEDSLGGNLLILPTTADALTTVITHLDNLPAVESYQFDPAYTTAIVAVNGDSDMAARLARARQRANPDAQMGEPTTSGGVIPNIDLAGLQLNLFTTQLALQPWSPGRVYSLSAGQDLSPTDPRSLLLPAGEVLDWLEIGVGDVVRVRFADGAEADLTVTGLFKGLPAGVTFQVNTNVGVSAYASPAAIPPDLPPSPSAIIAQVETTGLDAVTTTLAETPGVVIFQAALLNSFIARLVEQLSALPLAVAALALFTSSILIANTVSLATLERRREIGIMKALGLRSDQVLSLLLLENGLIGLCSGLVGVGLGAALTLGLLLSNPDNPARLPLGMMAGLVALATLIALLATLVTAIGAARAKPLTVLRYE